MWRGYSDHQVALLDGAGGVVTASLPGAVAPPAKALRASIAVQSALLAGGVGQLEVWQDASIFVAESTARWRLWWFNIGLTAVIIVAVLQVAIFLLVSRTLGLLVRSLRRMEMGYLGRGAGAGLGFSRARPRETSARRLTPPSRSSTPWPRAPRRGPELPAPRHRCR